MEFNIRIFLYFWQSFFRNPSGWRIGHLPQQIASRATETAHVGGNLLILTAHKGDQFFFIQRRSDEHKKGTDPQDQREGHASGPLPRTLPCCPALGSNRWDPCAETRFTGYGCDVVFGTGPGSEFLDIGQPSFQ